MIVPLPVCNFEGLFAGWLRVCASVVLCATLKRCLVLRLLPGVSGHLNERSEHDCRIIKTPRTELVTLDAGRCLLTCVVCST